MKIRYFADTDTLLINFTDKEITDTQDLNENVLIELDEYGGLVSMTVEHAEEQANITDFAYQQVAMRNIPDFPIRNEPRERIASSG